MNTSKKIKFKYQFKNLNFYSIPTSILFVVRKRFNLINWILILIGILLFTIV